MINQGDPRVQETGSSGTTGFSGGSSTMQGGSTYGSGTSGAYPDPQQTMSGGTAPSDHYGSSGTYQR